ncbi:AAA ATPase midasin [Vermiconidia calcicola]|uniref:AAA ATPase midasin n=1 Tax=Vermiconidia calcicola TaxID=1690605 RepID=A0ACC3MWM8_9PEZI|nr:AAA ATPase midasin [Vermiconidia calcicola]
MECTWDAALAQRSELLPPELLQIIAQAGNEQYLDAITSASLDPRYTYALFAHCEHIFAHVCATLRTHGSLASTIATLGRIIPFAPYLMPYAEHVLTAEKYQFNESYASEEDLGYLLGLFRLFAFDRRTIKKYIKPTEIASLLRSSSRPVNYVALRIFQVYLAGADHWFEQMVKRYLGEDTPEGGINGTWDDKVIDYRFLTLWEEDRFRTVLKLVEEVKSGAPATARSPRRTLPAECFHYSTAVIGGLLLPRMDPATREPAASDDDTLVHTPTILNNLRSIASALKSARPLLLTGLAGSGKTLLVRHAARKLGKLDKLVTLHLNEQSDAKLLVGIYTTGETPGSFVWRPGVLTAAIQEGRWVLIEDLDRAPNEVIGTLLPLIEKGELLIPSRKQTIYAAQGFRILATVRTSINHRGEETKPLAHMLGARHWQNVLIRIPAAVELRDIASELYPSLAGLLPQFITVFERLHSTRQRAVFLGQSKTGILRSISPRDLLKWCSRVRNILRERTALTSNDMDHIFLEAIDCFVGALPEGQALNSMASIIAEELRIDPQRREYLLSEREVRYELEKSRISVGRYSLSRAHQPGKARIPHDTFSTNPHTSRMLERVAAAVTNREPLLLVGETGVGKTTAVQHLASHLGKKLVAFNLSQQSEAGDLLGGFKPISPRSLIIPLKDDFDDLFTARFSRSKNQQFLDLLGKQISKSNWRAVCKLWQQALKMVDQQSAKSAAREGETPSKKRKVESKKADDVARWDSFAAKVTDLERRLAAGGNAFAFSFVEGSIVKAVRNGDWVLLDEINLASPDTLESIADLLDSDDPYILLTESGNIERIRAHPDFRVFAAMNPATDIGKKDLPPGIRSRFTELYVESPDKDLRSLQSIVRSYLGQEALNDQAVAMDISTLYQKITALSEQNRLVDGSGQRPHFSLRTLTRTLSYTRYIAPSCNLRRALYEGFQMSFMTFLDIESSKLVQPLLEQHLFSKRINIRAELQRALRKPSHGPHYAQAYPGSKHWLRQGSYPIEEQSQYILTPFIRQNLENLVRATSTRQFPVLIQGPTSSGKTSMIEYLAKRTGHKFVRINNHDHTDLQEYLGTYVSGLDGRLHFQEGVLVKALREGHWIVLDELNLAPTDVLEALNRLLDDNRELLVPETQEVVRPDEGFMLFATQNPAGLYGGRKALSRAFRNRFLELHFDDIPVDELQEILHKRTQLPESRCKGIVAVYRELSVLRQENRLFEQKSFATLRDLFRWALRANDTIEKLAANGFMLLAERVRKPEERQALKDVIERVMSTNGPRVRLDENVLYAMDSSEILQYQRSSSDQGIVWTKAMRRLYVLVSQAIQNNEPVLLVGETGCGKTTVCQMLADALSTTLHTVNAHQNTETGDIIGSQRPIRNRAAVESNLRDQLMSSNLLQSLDNAASTSTDTLFDVYDRAIAALAPCDRTGYCQSAAHAEVQNSRTRFKALFEWADGSLVQAMKEGAFFLLDEISLADDSVLERINSVLEPQRSILLAEKGSLDSFVAATSGFQCFATMNPGGDYGKRELSPALRNRFTEIWVPSLGDIEDIAQIVGAKLVQSAKSYAGAIVTFAQWFKDRYNTSASSSVSLRDALAWVNFVNALPGAEIRTAIVHGAAMVYIDTLGANPAGLMTMTASSLEQQRSLCLEQLGILLEVDAKAIYSAPIRITIDDHGLTANQFRLQRHGPNVGGRSTFSFEPPTTKVNATRILRALHLPKPVMLEGNPGVGKTALITAIADAIGMPLARINLSEQTDLLDLFGSDVPVEGSQAGTFIWRDAPFLRAMKQGEWVLLDEMNLASQSVLEGLNACLDHRGEVYIPELGQKFTRHPDFRVFAAQNPHHQGGGRKGLPASFVNRFTVVFADAFRSEDLSLIARRLFPAVNSDAIAKVISFVEQLDGEAQHRRIGVNGGPWEFNLRDVSRWLSMISSDHGLLGSGTARDFIDFLFSQRFRSPADRAFISQLCFRFFEDTHRASDLFSSSSPSVIQLGLGFLPRDPSSAMPSSLAPYRPHTGTQPWSLQSIMLSIQQKWPVVLIGGSGSGKTTLIERLAAGTGAALTTISLNAESDAMDLVGGFEQAGPNRQALHSAAKLRERILTSAREALASRLPMDLLAGLEGFNEDTVPHEAHLADLAGILESDQSSGLATLLHEIQLSSRTTDKAQFEWVDGILVDAIQEGRWLVLDNANLCSPSVLDRLNSLLEDDGALIINEHSSEDGSARLLRPHPDFRVFLTCDPRYGELSRAMRNRSVELYLSVEEPVDSASYLCTVQLESKMASFHQTGAVLTSAASDTVSEALPFVVADHLGVADLPLIQRFYGQLNAGLHSIAPDVHRRLTSAGAISSQAFVESKSELQSAHEASISQSQVLTDFASVQVSRSASTLRSIEARVDEVETEVSLLARLRRTERLMNLRVTNSSSVLKSSVLLDWLKRNIREHLLSSPVFLLTPSELSTAKRILGSLSAFWNLLLQSIANDVLNPATLTTLLWVGQSTLRSSVSNTPPLLGPRLLRLCDSFRSITGVEDNDSREACVALWKSLRPDTPATHEVLQQVLHFETLVDRFDHICRHSELPLKHVADLRISLSRALALASHSKSDMTEITSKVDGLVVPLAVQDVNSMRPREAHFCQTFRRLHALFANLSLGNWMISPSDLARLEILAFRDTKSGIQYSTWLGQHTAQRRFSLLANSIAPVLEAPGSTNPYRSSEECLLEELATSEHVSLGHLQLLQDEVDTLGKTLCNQAHLLNKDGLESLDDCLEVLVVQVLTALVKSNTASEAREVARLLQVLLDRDAIESAIDQATKDLSRISLDTDFTAKVLLREFQSVVTYLRTSHIDRTIRLTRAARSWSLFATVSIQLYVTNTAFDPALDTLMRRNVYQQQHRYLASQLQALRTFNGRLNQSAEGLRARMLHEDIAALGPEPELDQICRPQISRFSELHAEVDALQRIIKLMMQAEGAMFDSFLPLNQNMLSNLVGVRNRLDKGYREYDDFTSPIVGFIDCLLTAHQVAERVQLDGLKQTSTSNLGSLMPLAGASPESWSLDESFVDVLPHLRAGPEELCWLSVIAFRSGLRPLTTSSPVLRDAVGQRFHQLYQRWKLELNEEQREAAAKSSLYRYKGQDDEADESSVEDLEELFPSNDAQPSATTTTTEHSRAQKLAHSIAHLHFNVFASRTIDSTMVQDLLRQWSHLVSADQSSHNGQRMLPTVIQELGKLQSALVAQDQTPSKYNIYTDANVREAKRLTSLTKSISRRFAELQRIWPEHATPTEVLRLCEGVLKTPHSTPIARLLPRLEGLHAAVNQWQTIASREYSVAEILEEIVDLIMAWRQLELSTWAGLLDHEKDYCERDAASWWYIAYETIVAATAGVQNSPIELYNHVEGLLRALGHFMASCGLGEYGPRLRMLHAFELQLATLQLDHPGLSSVHHALANFNLYYSRFQSAIEETLSRGRGELESQVKNVVRVASWKDRNIEVLKQSAHSSHRKLLRLVRKYRALLAQPVEPIIHRGVPANAGSSLLEGEAERPSRDTSIEQPPTKLRSLPLWENRPERFRNITSTAAMIISKTAQALQRYETQEQLIAFTSDLEQSIADLRKATPPVLTKENQALVNHLKTRKRRLLADVLKDLRTMGFQTSLSQQKISQQASMSILFAGLPVMEIDQGIPNVSDAQYQFHRLLGIMPAVRESARGHSDELTPAEIARCSSLLESMLEMSISQHKALATYVADYSAVKVISDQYSGFAFSEGPELSLDSRFMVSVELSQLHMLNTVLRAVLEILQFQGTLSGSDYSAIISEIAAKEAKAAQLVKEADNIPQLPMGVRTDQVRTFQTQRSSFASELQSLAQRIMISTPETEPVLSHLFRWSAAEVASGIQSQANGHAVTSLDGWVQDVFQTLDNILVAIQDVERRTRRSSVDVDSSSWFVLQQRSLHEATEALQMSNVSRKLSRLLSRLQSIKPTDDNTISLLATICRAMHPVIDAYCTSLRKLIGLSCSSYAQLSHTSFVLATSFIQLANQGFCSPSEKAEEGSFQAGQIDAGTGLGEGEGADDISKDIGDDEDLSELAQSSDRETRAEDAEDVKDAVDMADAEMGGELGEVPQDEEGENGESADHQDEAEMDEKPAEGDLGPSQVNEKMWDGDKDRSQHDKEAESGKGKSEADDRSAAADQQLEEQIPDQDGELVNEPETVAAETEQDEKPLATEEMDTHVHEEENLDLPEDIDMDRNKPSKADESDLESIASDQNGAEQSAVDSPIDEGAAPEGSQEEEEEEDHVQPGADAAEAGQDTEEEQQERDENDPPGLLMKEQRQPAQNQEPDDATFGEEGSGAEKNKGSGQQLGLQSEVEGASEEIEDQPNNDTDGVAGSLQQQGDSAQQTLPDSSDDQHGLPFKQLGDVLDEWYEQHRNIENADVSKGARGPEEQDLAEARFEHLPDADAEPDTQALGAASMDHSSKMNEESALPVNEKGVDADLPPENMDKEPEQRSEHEVQEDRMEVEPSDNLPQAQQLNSFIGSSNTVDDDVDMADRVSMSGVDEVDDVDEQLTNTHLSHEIEDTALPLEEAQKLWSKHEESTRNLALVLTEHLRLILQPTQATKMRGDFRTGKRLNIKRIIPYIASSYKRDKIWMRRSIPSKRSYQVMLAIDDSKSMAESHSYELAFETLALVAKSMSMLEVGELSVAGFGEHVNVAHDFSTPFTQDAGARVFQQFTFSQSKTNMQKLLAESIELFRAARLKAAGSSSDLWQLQLIISDGIYEDHPSIRQLVRQAHEERIMIVFVVVDPATQTNGNSSAAKKSILDLQTAEFVSDTSGEMQLKMTKYLDTFPFRYYLIVRNVQELPGVLAAALRQWFAEVVDTSG